MVVKEMSDTIAALLIELNLPSISNLITEDYCKTVLHDISRTNSGALSYAALQYIIKKDVFNYIIVPLSELVPPLKIRFSVGSFKSLAEENTFTSLFENRLGFKSSRPVLNRLWGLKCIIESVNIFELKCVTEESSQEKRNGLCVSLVYENETCLDFNKFKTHTFNGDISINLYSVV
jgi:hypothetical protein